jgi:hypothetical protein
MSSTTAEIVKVVTADLTNARNIPQDSSSRPPSIIFWSVVSGGLR